MNKYSIAILAFLTIVLAVISGRVQAFHWLSFFWILPFAFMLPGLKLKQAAVVSALCATLFWMGTTYWLVSANIHFSKSVAALVVIVFLIFCLWQALPYIVLALSYSYFNWKDSHLGPLLSASILTISWVLLPSPLPWIPQNSLYIYPEFVAVLDLSGMSLLLFLSTLFCFSIEYSLRKGVAYKKHYMGVVLGIPVLMLTYGEIRQIQLDNDKAETKEGQWLHIGYVQPALKYDDPFDSTYRLTERLIEQKSPDLIVWPEITSPYSFMNNKEDNRKTLHLVNRYHQDLIAVSGYVYTGQQTSDSVATYYNQAQLIKDGMLQGEYSKEILVPFFEYLPSPLAFLRPWMPNVLNYQAGNDQRPLNYNNHIHLAMAICYEIIFPEYIRGQIEKGGNIVINPVSDAVFEGGIGHYYHLSTAYFRSIENRVPWVRATNTGISLIVGADGKMLTPVSKIGAVNIDSAEVFIPNKTSVYSRIGDWFTLLLFASWLLYFAFRRDR